MAWMAYLIISGTVPQKYTVKINNQAVVFTVPVKVEKIGKVTRVSAL